MLFRSKGLFISTSVNNGILAIEVRDEGKGISEKDLLNVMDPFFTTKRDSGGTGLGLAISDGIVRDMGGEIRISSKLGEGTLVKVLLPAKLAAADHAIQGDASDGGGK